MALVVDPLASYAPRAVRQRLAAASTPLNGPQLVRQPAAVLFADISGFTPLTRQHAQRGPAGVEQFGRVLDDYFGRLLTTIDTHGGDAIKLAGDALLAVWTVAPDEDLADTVCRASQCALAVLAELNDYDAGDGIRLALHAAIGAGESMAIDVGGIAGRWYHVVAGEPVLQIESALQQADPGALVLSAEAWALVQERGNGEVLEVGCARLQSINHPLTLRPTAPIDLPLGAQTALAEYLPTAIRARLAAGHAGWLAEFRRVSTLFLGLPDLDQTTPDTLVQAQAVLATVEPIFARLEGVAHDLYFDEKGVTLVVLFGLPPQAHEDDAARAVQAAQAIQAAIAAQGHRSALGIATGRVFCGTVGNDARREYTQVGEVMNLAARLMSIATDAILCDDATVASLRGRVTFDVLPPVQIKGHTEPVAVFRPGAGPATGGAVPRLAGEGDRPMIGRADERATLADALDRLHAGSGATIIVEGEAGLGKTRLLHDLLAQASAYGLPALVGTADAIEQATPYYAWRPVVSRLLGLDLLADADPEARRAHVLARLQDDPALLRLAPLLSGVVAVDVPETPLTLAMAGEVRAENTRDAIVQLLQRAVAPIGSASDSPGRPQSIVLEDAHWLDSASWVLARQVAERVAPVLLVLATRPLVEPLPTAYRQLVHAPQTTILRLAALGPAEIEALVSHRLGVRALPASVARLIVERAEGNPFYSEELSLTLREAGVITVQDGACHLAPTVGDLRALALPDTVQGVVTSRIDRLSPRQQLALKVASVVGRTFAHRILRDVHPVANDRPHLAAELSVLARHDLTVQERPEPDLAHLFKHVITQESAYSLLPFAQRRTLHHAVADWIERREASDLSPYYPLLAYHWGRAEVHAKALEYLGLAGEQALQSSTYQEAVDFLTEALRLDAASSTASDDAQRAHWERLLGDAQLGLGRLAEGRAHYERALALLGQPVPQTKIGFFASLAGQIGRQLLHRVWPSRFVGSRPHLSAADAEAAMAHERLSEIHYFGQEMFPTLHSLFRSLNPLEAAGPSAALARIYVNACIGAGLAPLHALAERYRALAIATARSVDDLAALSWVMHVAGIYDTGIGNWARAHLALQEAAEISVRLGDWRRWESTLKLHSLVYAHQGEFATAAQLGADCYASGKRRGDKQGQACGLQTLVEHALVEGRLDDALALVEEARGLADDTADRLAQLWTNGLLALTRHRLGERRLALEAAERAMRFIDGSAPSGPWTRDAYAAVTEVYLDCWAEGDRACARLADRACAALARFAKVYPTTESLVGLYHGRRAWQRGRRATARRHWQRGLAAAQRLAIPFDEARLHVEIGRHLPETDPARCEHLETARAILARIGATAELAQMDDTLHDPQTNDLREPR